VKAPRDGDEVTRSLTALQAAAARNENVMPGILAAVNAYATLGEITEVLRQTFGAYREPRVI
jgi:methylmalonyl-CoA mutase, N-terminal domain